MRRGTVLTAGAQARYDGHVRVAFDGNQGRAGRLTGDDEISEFHSRPRGRRRRKSSTGGDCPAAFARLGEVEKGLVECGAGRGASCGIQPKVAWSRSAGDKRDESGRRGAGTSRVVVQAVRVSRAAARISLCMIQDESECVVD